VFLEGTTAVMVVADSFEEAKAKARQAISSNTEWDVHDSEAIVWEDNIELLHDPLCDCGTVDEEQGQDEKEAARRG
jgi:hypothetical protein